LLLERGLTGRLIATQRLHLSGIMRTILRSL
jgi:hypothetical protein